MKFGYLRALMTAYMVIWMLHALLKTPPVGVMILTMLIGWVIWQIAGGVDERMDQVAVMLRERIAPMLPSGRKRRK